MHGQALPTIQDVVDQHMCSGCGACAFAHPQELRMVDTLDQGRRPLACGSHGLAGLSAETICPGIGEDPTGPAAPQGIAELEENWGTVLEIWEGHAVDEQIRHQGSSGGVVTALALYALEQMHMAGVVHVKARQDAPLLNETNFSRDRESLLSGSGSRYAPASPCDQLQQIAEADRPCVFIGKPCDVAAAQKARRHNVHLDRNLGISMAIFCAGTPSVQGTIELAQALGAEKPEDISGVRYRGQGWPGKMEVSYRNGAGKPVSRTMDYAKGWGEILQRHRQWRCHVCPDHTGEAADLSVGDPWYRPIAANESGRSLVLVRTERGRQLIRQAMHAGYVQLEQRDAWVMDASQPHLRRAQAVVWGRVWATRLAGVGGLPRSTRRHFKRWLSQLSWREKLQSLVGTFRRVKRKRLRTPEAATQLGGDGLGEAIPSTKAVAS